MGDNSEMYTMAREIKKLQRIASGKAKTQPWTGKWKLDYRGRSIVDNATYGLCASMKKKEAATGQYQKDLLKIVPDKGDIQQRK